MRGLAIAAPAIRKICVLFVVLCAGILSLSIGSPVSAYAQSKDTRVLWKLNYNDQLSATQRDEAQAGMLKVLMRAKERHFVGDNIIRQKVKKEGVNFPECFTDGMPCTGGGHFILDVYNVDAYANVLFSHPNDEWELDLTLYRRLSGNATHIKRSGSSLNDLIQTVLSALFDMESEMEIQCTQPDVRVYVNQSYIGTAPVSVQIPTGKQVITFQKTGYVSQTWTFQAEKGKLYTKDITLEPELTQLTVLTSAPDAHILIDEDAPRAANEPMDILPGVHHVTVRADGYHDFEQDYKVYPGNPQSIQAALLPVSESPYQIRHRGISKYRLSGNLGYYYSHQKLSLLDSKATFYDIAVPTEAQYNADDRYVTGSFKPARGGWGNADFHGISLSLDYEAEYWGLAFMRFDIAGASLDENFKMVHSRRGKPDVITQAKAESAMHIGFYPAQIKGHYTFWVMQFEALGGIGLSHTQVNAKRGYKSFTLSETAFSLNLNAAIKYYLSESSYVSLGYDFQADFGSDTIVRNGLSVRFGMQFPVWMRSETAAFSSDTDETIVDSQTSSEPPAASDAYESSETDAIITQDEHPDTEGR